MFSLWVHEEDFPYVCLCWDSAQSDVLRVSPEPLMLSPQAGNPLVTWRVKEWDVLIRLLHAYAHGETPSCFYRLPDLSLPTLSAPGVEPFVLYHVRQVLRPCANLSLIYMRDLLVAQYVLWWTTVVPGGQIFCVTWSTEVSMWSTLQTPPHVTLCHKTLEPLDAEHIPFHDHSLSSEEPLDMAVFYYMSGWLCWSALRSYFGYHRFRRIWWCDVWWSRPGCHVSRAGFLNRHTVSRLHTFMEACGYRCTYSARKEGFQAGRALYVHLWTRSPRD